MSQPCFLLDEHVPKAIARGLYYREAEVQVFIMSGPGAPPIGTPDPDLLRWIEDHNCFLVTNNRSSMPTHLRDHLAAGRHVAGILVVPRRLSLGDVIDDLHLIWAASRPDEYQDQMVFLPLAR